MTDCPICRDANLTDCVLDRLNPSLNARHPDTRELLALFPRSRDLREKARLGAVTGRRRETINGPEFVRARSALARFVRDEGRMWGRGGS